MITKRQLGILLALSGAAVGIGAIAVDLVGAGDWSGFGPLQWIGLGGGFVVLVIGLILTRLGDRPA